MAAVVRSIRARGSLAACLAIALAFRPAAGTHVGLARGSVRLVLPCVGMPAATGALSSAARPRQLHAVRPPLSMLLRPPIPDEGAGGNAAMCALAAGSGGATALLVVAFKRAVLECSTLLHTPMLADGSPPPFWALPVLGGCAVAALRLVTPRETFDSSLGSNVQAATDGLPVDLPAALVRTLASVLTLGSGCSLGPEGPAVELGATVSRLSAAFAAASVGSNSGRGLSKAQRRTLVCSGAAAGVAAGFNAPLAAIAFAYEVASARRSSSPAADAGGTVEMPKFVALLPVVVSSLSSAAVAQRLLANELSFAPASALGAAGDSGAYIAELPIYLVLGCFCGGGAVFFRSALKGARWAFRERVEPRLDRALHPLLGGMACGLVSVAVPQVQFSSYETLDRLVETWSRLASPADPLSLFGAKVAATSLCLSAGLVGGLFAPSLFLGAALGATFAQTADGVSHLLGVAEAVPSEIILTGAASVLGAVFSSPCTATLLVFDLTHNPRLLLPSLLAATIASALTAELAPESGPAQPPPLPPPSAEASDAGGVSADVLGAKRRR